jgi:hypothetical protein
MLKQILIRTSSVFVVAATSNIGVGAIINIAVWKSALLAGVIALVDVAQKLGHAYLDGVLTEEELKEIFK